MKHLLLFTCIVLLWLSIFRCNSSSNNEWREYLGGPDRNHYSALDQINTENVNKLQVAWEYHTQDSGQIQCNPIIVDGILYGMTATVQPFALNARTGEEIWRMKDTTGTTWYGTSRGVSYWEDKDDQRILFTKESWLYALNAKTGKVINSFGDGGRVSLRTGLGEMAEDKFVISNTPGTVYQDLIIMPIRVSEDSDAALGHIQAFNVRTGKLEWIFKTIPEPGTHGYNTWPKEAYKNIDIGGANNWAGMAIDRERGIVYVPTGSAAFDYYGGKRLGANLFANCLLALDVKTGERKWHYQFVHHDILDRDPPAPPNLLTVTHNGKKIDAVAQVTKQGYVFVFNRETGEALFPIEEVPVPQSDIPGEQAWPTQPKPVKPLSFSRQNLTEEEINPYADNKQELLEKFRNSRNEGPFTPLSRAGTIIFPGLDGGAEWGGAAVDPNGIMYINSSEMPWLISLNEKTVSKEVINPGEQIYAANCSSCHGSERKGNAASGFPSLVDLNNRHQREHVLDVITKGKGMMPAFKKLSVTEKKFLIAFLYGDPIGEEGDKMEAIDRSSTSAEVSYKISGFTKFLDNKGYPAISPPWGTLNAIDLNTGEYLWKKIFGESPELQKQGAPQTGSESYGGPVITAGGVLFIAGTKDKKFRAYNMKTGDLIWETVLPAAGFATPSTYAVNGKQYIVIACGGTKLGATKGESYVAFSLPD
ncbi:outer membrane protein assembly factor BamB family protein [Chryseosolibacter indicus]|uniref:PQQ-binding-like beta-propeller repeat protein n=1 Tax=Chryseosolibacter indicus TaxID=2782351 RepID=A0ABS5VRB6_9BACT|nr:PQQ-binding-like beta-propeller repeat protein [Chryseosolibacter indicus]MBT1703370.1 PQQ-binding-like beta-propeller repeat protein [Chryseosolibacter indicus]